MMKFVCLLLCFVVFVYAADLDGDGYDSDASFGEFQDCCDSVADGCFDPYLVNPGAWEIPSNGQADRCIEGRDVNNHLTCDDITPAFPQVGATVPPVDTEDAILALDICEFKDDDDDPSWGFVRQKNMVYSLSDKTRNGFDIGVVGPDSDQVEIQNRYGRYGPANGERFLAMSTEGVYDFQPGGVSIDTQSAPPPTKYTNAPSLDPIEAGCGPKPTSVQDSIMATFYMVQPTNMNAWSLKTSMLDGERRSAVDAGTVTNGGFGNTFCSLFESVNVILSGASVGVPPDSNIAMDSEGSTFRSFNPDVDFFTYCNSYGFSQGKTQCPNTEFAFLGTELQDGFGTEWIAVGSSAVAGEEFEINLAVWDTGDDGIATNVFYDDYMPIAEARTYMNPYGYQFTSDIELESVTPNRNGIYPSGTSQVTISFSVKNNGPQQAGDITINFTPPLGSSYRISTGPSATASIVKQALAPFQNNSFYKLTFGNTVLQVGQSLQGSITFNILANHPKDMQFKLSATCSSIEKLFQNNYFIQQIYIEE